MKCKFDLFREIPKLHAGLTPFFIATARLNLLRFTIDGSSETEFFLCNPGTVNKSAVSMIVGLFEAVSCVSEFD